MAMQSKSSRRDPSLYFYLFKCQCLVNGAAYFGLHGSVSPEWGDDGFRFEHASPKLNDLMKIHGRNNFRTTVELVSTNREVVENRLNQILRDVAGHPLSLNTTKEEFSQKMSEALVGKEKAPAHKAEIANSMQGNTNSLGNVVSVETADKISASRAAKNLKWIHNKEHRAEMQIEKGEDLLTGFEYGRLPKELRNKPPAKTTSKKNPPIIKANT